MTSIIDLRSDTVTKPTSIMRQNMASAIVGDDVYREDPTVKLLEERVANMFQKESALFFPSGTMSNLSAILSWCPNRGSEIIVGDNSHIFLFEQSGASQFGGVSFRTVANQTDGTMGIQNIKLAIREDDIHEPMTKLICIENTHNVCGGCVLPISFLKNLRQLSEEHKIPIHLDGARLWNAITALNIEPCEISKYVDSLTVCLSKGLGAPVGSLLVGPKNFIERARRIRKALGGGMRQVGILAAAGITALDDFNKGILNVDHKNTEKLANAINSMNAFKICRNVDTNIIFFNVVLYDKLWFKENISANIVSILKEKGILVSAWSNILIRIVVHRNISDSDIETVIKELNELSCRLKDQIV